MTQAIYLKDSAAGAFRALQVGGSVPSTTTTATGWVVGTTAATAYSQMASNTERAASTFGATAMPPDSGPDSALGDGFRSENVINGRFAAGSWTIPIPVIRVTAGTTADGRVRVRLWRSPNADGSAATEITSGAQTGTTVTNLTNVEQISTVTVTLPEFGLVDEYLFLSVAWEITGAGGGATDDVNIRVGANATITAQTLTVATLTEYWAVLAGQGLIFSKKDYVRKMAQAFAAQVSSESAGVRLGESVSSMPGYAGGSGYPNYDADNPTRYYQGPGIDVTTTTDKAQVGPGLTTSLSTAVAALRVLNAANGLLYAGSSVGGVYTQTALDTWSLAGTITSTPEVSGVAYAESGINNLSARVIAINRVNAKLAGWVSPTFTNNIADADNASFADRMSYFTIAKAFLGGALWLGGKLQSGNQGRWSLPITTTWSTRWGGASATGAASLGYPDITVMQVMPNSSAGTPTGFVVAADLSALICEVHLFAGSGSSFTNTIIDTLTDDAIIASAAIGNVCYFATMGGRIYSADATTTNPLTLVATGVSSAGSNLYGLAAWNNALWIAMRSGTSLLIRRFGPVTIGDAIADWRWSEPIYGGTVDASATAARQLYVFGGDLYSAVEASGAAKVYRMRAGVYSTSAVTLQTGEITFDAPVIVKSVKVEHSALVASDSVQLKYSRNGSATFNSLGTNSTVDSTSTNYPVAASGQVTRLSVQAVITAGSSAATPQLGELTIVVRPIGEVTRTWTIKVQMFGTATKPDTRKDGTPEPHTGQVIDDTLWQIIGEGKDQRFRDIDGSIANVTAESFDDHPQEELYHGESMRFSGTLTLKEI